jgi:molecular chaperone DnaK
MAEIAVGIDLGTSNSCVAIARGGKVEVLPNAYGEHVTASVVAFDEEGCITVGNAAKANVIHDPLNTVSSAKRLIGRYYFSEEVKKAQAVYSYSIVEGPSHSLRIQIRDEQFSLPEISAMVLREMKTIAEENLGQEVHQAVITVPAYFNDNQRQATRDAGRIAGLEVLRLLNEPTAAALAYGFGRSLSQRVAVYDFGGGTFDISILEIGKDVFEVLSTCGDTYLGGDDFDDRLIDLLADEFAAKEGINLRNDPFALEKLKVAAEAAKKGLSVEEQVEIRIPDILNGPDGQPRSIERTIGRAEYSSLVMDLVQRTFKVCDEALQQAKMVARDLGGVILVGGPTRLPVIRQAVTEYFQQEPRVDVDPDEVVAMGAAIHAASLCSTEQQDSFLLDVTPLSLRIGVAGGLAESVIDRNTPVPIEQTRAFTTYQDFQESVKIKVFQGESRQADENEMLGQFEFSGFKKARRGEVRIDVTFEINSDGIVNVTARDQETGQQASTQITLSSGLSEDEIDQIIGEGRTTERMRSGNGADGDSPAPVEAPGPAGEEVCDELDLFQDAGDSLDELPDLEVDQEDEATAPVSGEAEEEADPNATTRPDLEPPAAATAPETPVEVDVEAADPNATTAGELVEVQPPGRADGIASDDLDGSPDDKVEIQTGSESFFDESCTDLSQYSDGESSHDKPER